MSVSLSVDWWRVSMIAVVVIAIAYSLWRFLPRTIPKFAKGVSPLPAGPDPQTIVVRNKEHAPAGTKEYLEMIVSDTPLATDQQRLQWATAELTRFDVVKAYAAELEQNLRGKNDAQT